MGPMLVSMVSINVAISASTATSSFNATPPILLAVVCAPARSRSAQMILWGRSAANLSAIARPIPPPAPVMTITLFVSSICVPFLGLGLV